MAALWAHAQTVTAALPFSRPAPRGVTHERVELPLPAHPDGGGVLIASCTFQPKPGPAVVVLHGVSGSSEDHYVVRAARALVRAGFHVARLNQRGSGLGMGRSMQLGHAALGDDLAHVVRFLAARDDVTSVGALGFSLGGHIALSLAADLGTDVGSDVSSDQARLAKLRAIVSVSAPIDLAESTRAFDALRAGRFTGIYERLIVRSLIERGRALKANAPSSPFTVEQLLRIRSISDFDTLVTCPTHGFRDVADYHARASVAPKLARITLPTLAIHAEDDPMVPVHALRRAFEAADRSRAFDVAIVPTGGHVGFVESLAHLWDTSTAVARALDHLRRHLT